MVDALKNFAYSTVATAPSPATSGTSLVVASGNGALFPAVPFTAVVWPANTQPLASNAEIIRVTAVSTDTLTIVRAQEGTSARTIVAGDQISQSVTSGLLGQLTQYADNLISPVAAGTLRYGVAAAPYQPVRIAFTGSSTTSGSSATTTARRYVDRMIAKLQTAHPNGTGLESTVVASTSASFGTLTTNNGVHGYNAGESGTDASSYLDNTESAAIAALNPVAIIHMIGANDYNNDTSPATFKTNLLARVNYIKSQLTRPCVQILVQSYRRQDKVSPTYAWTLYGDAQREIALADPDNVAFVNLEPFFNQTGLTTADPYSILADTVHMGDAGHEFVADVLANQIFGLGANTQPTIAAPVVFDNFNATSNTTVLSSRTPVVGSAWTKVSSTGASGMEFGITNNTAYASSATSGFGFTYLESGLADATIEMTLSTAAGSNATKGGGLAFRLTDGNNAWILSTRQSSSNGTYTLIKDVANSPTNVATSAVTSATGDRMKVVTSGSLIVCYVNGVEIMRVTDSFNATATKHGIYTNSSGTTNRYDDFKVSAESSLTTQHERNYNAGLTGNVQAQLDVLTANSGVPAGGVMRVFKSGGVYTRPNTRTDISVFFIGDTTPPNATTPGTTTDGMYPNDLYIATA